ncbi:hypothetical protein GCM10025786_24900 [Nocardioides caeni]
MYGGKGPLGAVGGVAALPATGVGFSPVLFIALALALILAGLLIVRSHRIAIANAAASSATVELSARPWRKG